MVITNHLHSSALYVHQPVIHVTNQPQIALVATVTVLNIGIFMISSVLKAALLVILTLAQNARNVIQSVPHAKIPLQHVHLVTFLKYTSFSLVSIA